MSTQRVNIQYSVKIDELESEVQRLASKAKKVLEDCVSANKKSLGSVTLSTQCYDDLDSIRHSLMEADAILNDINMIISSFVSYKAQQISQSVPTREVPENIQNTFEGNNLEELSEIHDKINNFKSKLANIESEHSHESDIG